VASDPLMCLAYVGIKGGMVVLVADDPGPISSQTEQDTRRFAEYSNLPLLDPTTPNEAYEMMRYAFELSEQIGLPVILRPTTRICHSSAVLDEEEQNVNIEAEGFIKDQKWVIFPSLSYKNHLLLEEKQKQLSDLFSESPFNSITGNGKVGIAAGGMAYSYAKEALADLGLSARILKLGAVYPFPSALAAKFLDGLERVLVLEELDDVIEQKLLETAGKYHINTEILGKRTRNTPCAGEFSYEIAKKVIAGFFGIEFQAEETPPCAVLPARPPVLCAGCSHRAAFYAVKKAMKGQDAVFTGDIGCYTLGNAAPLSMVDTCLCMGAGVTVAQGMQCAGNKAHHIAFIGDSTFFHSGITGLINAIYNKIDVTIVVLNNATTAMTGHQPHPGTGKTMMREVAQSVDIEKLVRACGTDFVQRLSPFNQERAVDAVRKAVSVKGVSVLIFDSTCAALQKAKSFASINDKCTQCKRCLREIGCPAISGIGGRIAIDQSLCMGCGLCSQICPQSAIGMEVRP
ncbi:MAG: thiamine pyrophosphate-dependent enzyme, partial [Eubacteriales bacterium]